MENKSPDWNTYFKEIAKLCATRSPCHRLQVGCLIVKDNRIISQGYNGFLAGCPHVSVIRDNHEMMTIHAEINALCDCAKRGVQCEDATAYITHYPCINCIKSLLASGIKKVYYINDYKNDELVNYFSEISNINIIKI